MAVTPRILPLPGCLGIVTAELVWHLDGSLDQKRLRKKSDVWFGTRCL